jgi:hypothetical protein
MTRLFQSDMPRDLREPDLREDLRCLRDARRVDAILLEPGIFRTGA